MTPEFITAWSTIGLVLVTLGLAIVTYALVRVTARYTKLTQRVSESSAAAAVAAQRSADAAERSLVLAGMPGLTVIGEVDISSVPIGEGGRWTLPMIVRVPIENVGPGVALNVIARARVSGMPYRIEGTLHSRALCLRVGSEGRSKLEAHRPTEAPESTNETELQGEIELVCEDVFGNEWSTTWPIQITNKGGVLGPRSVRRVSDPAT